MEPKRVVITGATGFIGTRLTQAFERISTEVIAVAHTECPPTECERVYHLACPSTTAFLNAHPQEIIDIIVDGTRQAAKICPSALFVNASSLGAAYLGVENTPQMAYNVAKRCMELYLSFSNIESVMYRLPSVYGEGMSNDAFVKRCIDGTAYKPHDPTQQHYIAHIDDVVHALVTLTPVPIEVITLGEIYESFGSGRRGLHRSSPITRTA